MSRLNLSLPIPLLKSYIFSHFSEISVDDFFEVVKKISIPSQYFEMNKVLNHSSEVLSYMLDIDAYAFYYFDGEALSSECIRKIAKSGVKIYLSDIDTFPQLLGSEDIILKIILDFPMIVRKLKNEQITDKVLNILEEADYVPSDEDFDKRPLIFTRDILLKRGIKVNPHLICKLNNIDEDMLNIAIKNGFIPTRQDFYDYPHLKNYDSLLQIAFENDPSVIVFFNEEQLTYPILMSAYERKYTPSEKDLCESPNLCRVGFLLDRAIDREPRLITLAREGAHLYHGIVEKALSEYKITKEDLENNPDLTKISIIMHNLPELGLYSSFLLERDKKNVLNKFFKEAQELTIKEIPFLDYRFGGKVDIDKLNELYKCLYLSVDENSIDEQQRYFQILDKLIDGIVNIRYTKNKEKFRYSDIVALDNDINYYFYKFSKTGDQSFISNFIADLSKFVCNTLSVDYIREKIEEFYKIYEVENVIGLEVTSDFCNLLLNSHRNYFVSEEKKRILDKLMSSLNLANKKKNKILNGRKLEKITKLIKRNDFSKLKISEEQFSNLVENTKQAILSNKDIIKSKIEIDVLSLDRLVLAFLYYGSLSNETVRNVLNIQDIEVQDYIVKKFEQIKFKLINNISLSNEESFIHDWEKEKFGFNYNNYLIYDEERYFNNLGELLLLLDDELADKILDSKESLREISYLLPLVGLVDEFGIFTFLDIISNYERIKNKILGDDDSVSEKNILKRIDDFITLGNAYNAVDDITYFALGEEIFYEIQEGSSKEYLDFYLRMTKRDLGIIPPISIRTSEYYLESGVYADPKRLLIGKRPFENSCIDLLNSGGVRTYEEVLLKPSGDAILVRDKDNNFISRILLFRRGNIVQMVCRAKSSFAIDVYQKIADEIINMAIDNNDNIDYVFVNKSSVDIDSIEGYPLYKDKRFNTKFPHADFVYNAVLLNSKSKVLGIEEDNINFQFDEEAKAFYPKVRKKISYQATSEEITRLRALNIVMEDDQEVKELLSRQFEPFYDKEYDKVICGEDWYIALKKDGTIEELVLPVATDSTYQELESVKFELGLDKSKLR